MGTNEINDNAKEHICCINERTIIMKYEEKYERALKVASQWHKDGIGDVKTIVECIFPELRESEDERIRKILLEKTHQWHEIALSKRIKQDVDDSLKAIGWLKKQGEQKPTDKVEPKFKVGDWIVYSRNDSSMEILYVYDIRDGRYYFNDNVHFSWSVKECDEKSHLWTIQDAKDGDVLYFNNVISGFHSIGLFKRLASKNEINGNTYRCYARYGGFNEESKLEIAQNNNELHHCGTKAYPATKEQRDTLEKAMADAGYTFDFEKKELKKIEQKSVEWSEEDEKQIRQIERIVKDSGASTNLQNKISDWLKSIKPNHWKPSKEQMKALNTAVAVFRGLQGTYPIKDIESLYNDLKTFES